MVVTLDSNSHFPRLCQASLVNPLRRLSGLELGLVDLYVLRWRQTGPSCAPSNIMLPLSQLSGSHRSLSPMRITCNLKWFRIMLWGLRQSATKRQRCLTSEPRFGSTPWECTWNCAHNSSVQVPPSYSHPSHFLVTSPLLLLRLSSTLGRTPGLVLPNP